MKTSSKAIAFAALLQEFFLERLIQQMAGGGRQSAGPARIP